MDVPCGYLDLFLEPSQVREVAFDLELHRMSPNKIGPRAASMKVCCDYLVLISSGSRFREGPNPRIGAR